MYVHVNVLIMFLNVSPLLLYVGLKKTSPSAGASDYCDLLHPCQFHALQRQSVKWTRWTSVRVARFALSWPLDRKHV